ncbi:diaminopropionate ammonia-lyase [Intestinibacter sp.]|uniref:diaminopropionate ammonia-lyase n=1 Tax=Intestinibacter sp. TaxID=1965304 RepID=UPI002A758C87|nr:diaminopropionate ammonia-lyase [Intestinibacter sp.]MDY2734748.1 diaminopropionate ammonia-lyase [Intestinibacter sp.]MDY4573771.1 diaminopropionate ammonia-lyase [Intestinibacter sp.]
MIKYKEHFGISIISTETNPSTYVDFLTEAIVNDVEKFHKSIEGYEKTPLVKLDNLARKLGVKNIFVKDESYRYGLNAFKGLGGLYAIFRIVCDKLNLDPSSTTFEDLQSEEIKQKLKDIVFVTATDGNHGKGVAWAANKLGCKSVVFMPKGSVLARAKAIESMGNSTVTITDLNYDDAVRKASSLADEKGWYLVQDTAWEGYEDVPNFISQGYTIMAKEALDELNELGIEKPTHLFLQAGVGSMAGSVLGYMVNRFDKKPPITTIVEPATVACIYKSALADDSKPHAVTGDLQTIMAGLNCGEPNTATWPILRDYASFYAACPDYVTARGMRVLASPINDDKKVISGESGAVGTGLLSILMEKDEFIDIRKDMNLDENSTVLIFSTEGNTDPKGYDEIVYDGRNYSPFV